MRIDPYGQNINDYTFNKAVHNNDHYPLIVDPYICGYCETCFESRNKLFYHLGFMGINIQTSTKFEMKKKQYKRRISHAQDNINKKTCLENELCDKLSSGLKLY
jgi:hypothetical protein